MSAAHHRRRRAVINYVPLASAAAGRRIQEETPLMPVPTRVHLPTRQVDPDPNHPDTWWDPAPERLSSHEWGRAVAPAVRRGTFADTSSKSLHDLIQTGRGRLTTEYLEGGEPSSEDLATLMWEALYRAELALRGAVRYQSADSEDTGLATAGAASGPAASEPDWPPPDTTVLVSAGHGLTFAARAPGALTSA